jgi:hypothetical protein
MDFHTYTAILFFAVSEACGLPSFVASTDLRDASEHEAKLIESKEHQVWSELVIVLLTSHHLSWRFGLRWHSDQSVLLYLWVTILVRTKTNFASNSGLAPSCGSWQWPMDSFKGAAASETSKSIQTSKNPFVLRRLVSYRTMTWWL